MTGEQAGNSPGDDASAWHRRCQARRVPGAVGARHRGVRAAAVAALALMALLGGFALHAALTAQPQGDTGTAIIPQGSMTDEEARAMLDAQAEASRITVSIRPRPELEADGMLHVNFAVVEPNNGLSERLEIEQDGRIVYRSGVVAPGSVVARGRSEGAHAGPAIATVRAVGEDGADRGNPVSIELEIVAAGE